MFLTWGILQLGCPWRGRKPLSWHHHALLQTSFITFCRSRKAVCRLGIREGAHHSPLTQQEMRRKIITLRYCISFLVEPLSAMMHPLMGKQLSVEESLKPYSQEAGVGCKEPVQMSGWCPGSTWIPGNLQSLEAEPPQFFCKRRANPTAWNKNLDSSLLLPSGFPSGG